MEAPVLRRLYLKATRAIQKGVLPQLGGLRSRGWGAYTVLFLRGDAPGWVLSEEVKSLQKISRNLGIATENPIWSEAVKDQSVFYTSHFDLLLRKKLPQANRLAMAYFHGIPGTGDPVFDRAYAGLCSNHGLIDRVQVSHREMLTAVLASGIDPAKVHLIPIGVDMSIFSLRTDASRSRARKRLGIPDTASVVGSFQKDGVGWDEGLEPKLVKGPDTLIRVIGKLNATIPGLFVLLSGPARGYVITGFRAMGVSFSHVYLSNYADVADLYHALDVYVVTSRQEGGPKAVLESMASGVPLITTRVGQAADLVHHGVNGWMVDVDDVDGLVSCCANALSKPSDIGRVVQAAHSTALANSTQAQLPLWAEFFRGFVRMADGRN